MITSKDTCSEHLVQIRQSFYANSGFNKPCPDEHLGKTRVWNVFEILSGRGNRPDKPWIINAGDN